MKCTPGEFDDADEEAYENRVQAYRDSHSALAVSDESGDVVFEGGFRVPADIYTRLFDYQKTGTAQNLSTFESLGLCAREHLRPSVKQEAKCLDTADHAGLERMTTRHITVWWGLRRLDLGAAICRRREVAVGAAHAARWRHHRR